MFCLPPFYCYDAKPLPIFLMCSSLVWAGLMCPLHHYYRKLQCFSLHFLASFQKLLNFPQIMQLKLPSLLRFSDLKHNLSFCPLYIILLRCQTSHQRLVLSYSQKLHGCGSSFHCFMPSFRCCSWWHI